MDNDLEAPVTITSLPRTKPINNASPPIGAAPQAIPPPAASQNSSPEPTMPTPTEPTMPTPTAQGGVTVPSTPEAKAPHPEPEAIGLPGQAVEPLHSGPLHDQPNPKQQEPRPLSGTGNDIRLPRWAFPPTSRSYKMNFSLISQIDGLAFKCLGPGARISRDVFAHTLDTAFCRIYGHKPWMSTGSFCGLYLCDFDKMPEVIAKVASDKGYGIFVVPVRPHARPSFSILQKGLTAGQWRYYGWYDYLMSKALLTFDLPRDTFTTLTSGPIRLPYGVQAVLAQFGHNGQFKIRPRPEKRFSLKIIPSLTGPKLGVRPVLTHLASPLSWSGGPTRVNDIFPASPKFAVDKDALPPVPLESRWKGVLPEFEKLASDFPCPHVARLAIECLTTGLNTYKGTLDKPVLHKEPPKRNDAEESAKRATIMKEVLARRIAGPFTSCPFENARVCPTDTREKDPYDPKSTRLRLISDFSRTPKGLERGSTNDLCWTPQLLSYHATAEHIRDTLAWLHLNHGTGTLAWTADIPSCFRLNHLNATLLSLFVYKVVTKEHGTEWFSDLATPFGWQPAEWGWQCNLALILWALRKAALEDMIAYVDNFFLLAHPAAPGPDIKTLFETTEAVFKRLDIPLHERMSGTLFKGLGWMWDSSSTTEPPSMICAADKYTHLCAKLVEWSAATELPFKEIERIIGFLTWISAGFLIGRPQLASLRAELRRRKHIMYNAANRRHVLILSHRARQCLHFWNKFVPKWDGRCTVFLDFGPMAGPEVLWRLDASTEWGMGAVMWTIGEPEGLYILHEWTEEERKTAFVAERESTGVLEAMAAARCARAFAKLCIGKRVLMEMDNESLSHGIRKGYSKMDSMMTIIRRVCERTASSRIVLRSAHIKGTQCATCLL
jgi:hypothetical protein